MALGSVSNYVKQLDDIYKVKPNRWYQTHPYAFRFTPRSHFSPSPSDPGAILMNLPIQPYNLTTTTHLATNVVTTLYGIVEQHSEVRYWDIVIAGTTGYAPQYFAPTDFTGLFEEDEPGGLTDWETQRKYSQQGRVTHDLDNSIIPQGATTTGGQAIALAQSLGIGTSAIGAIGQIAEDAAALDAAGSNTPKSKTGVRAKASGYVAFHNLYRFFLNYKKDAAGINAESGDEPPKFHPLQFINYKDNIKYDCAPIDFTLVRSADDPMVYNYTIKLKCYNMRQVTGGQVSGAASLKNFLASMGLGAGSNDPQQIANIQDTIAAAINLVSTLTDLI